MVVPLFFRTAPHPGCGFLAPSALRAGGRRCGSCGLRRMSASCALRGGYYFSGMTDLPSKSELRKTLLTARREHVAAQPAAIQALLFNRPPAPITEKIGADAVIGLYHAGPYEAPARGYARFFQEAGHTIALPYFAADDAAMEFRVHTDPHDESDLAPGAFGIKQPRAGADAVTPDVLFVPLVGFTADLARLGQGGGHYDRWLAQHPGRIAIGLAWDAQLADALPVEPHDMILDAVITPTRIYGLD